MKRALLNIATDVGLTAAPSFTEPTTQLGWAGLAHQLGVQVIHIAERDTQVTATPKARGEFVNTYVTVVIGAVGRPQRKSECALVFESVS